MNLLTIGTIARQLGEPPKRVDYAVAKAGIKEVGRAGILRLFSPAQVAEIRAAVASIRPRPTKEGGGTRDTRVIEHRIDANKERTP